MKYLYYFERFKVSEKFGNPLTETEFTKLYDKHCKYHKEIEYIGSEGSEGSGLYRGVRNIEADENIIGYYQNPKGHIRKSIENINLHVILMSELNSWKDYPKYNQSIIGSTRANDAADYSSGGLLFEIIPYDNSKVGVCSKDHIWNAFGGYGDHTNNPIYYTTNFLEYVLDFTEDGEYNSSKYTWKEIKDRLKSKNIYETWNDLDEYRKEEIEPFIEKMMDSTQPKHIEIEDYMKTIKYTDIIKFIEREFDPNKWGFTSLIYDDSFNEHLAEHKNNYQSFNGSGALQIWCGGPVLLKIESK